MVVCEYAQCQKGSCELCSFPCMLLSRRPCGSQEWWIPTHTASLMWGRALDPSKFHAVPYTLLSSWDTGIMPSVSENRKVVISSGVWEKTEKQRSGPDPAHHCLPGGFWWDRHISLFHPRSLGEYLYWLSCSDPSEYLQFLHKPLTVQCRTWWKVEGKCPCQGERRELRKHSDGKYPYLFSRTSEDLKVKLILRWSQPLTLMRLLIEATIFWRVMKGMRKWGKESRKEGGRKETGKSHTVEGTLLKTDIAQSLVFLEQG